jgi:hypothetical protein
MPRADLTIPRTTYGGTKMTGTLDLRSHAKAEFEPILDAAIAAVRADHQVSLNAALEDALERLDRLEEPLHMAIYNALYRHALRSALVERLERPLRGSPT